MTEGIRKGTRDEVKIAEDQAREVSDGSGGDQVHSLVTGQILRDRKLCPLVMTRGRDSGVHVGLLTRYENGDAELLEARRLWAWAGPINTLNEVCSKGIERYRLSEPIPQIVILDARELIKVEERAIPSLTTSRWDNV